jgi:dTDP-4-dehydrorhamnose 3,5-epimerase-like enzyme
MKINYKDPKIYKFQKYIDKRGYLIPFEYSTEKKGVNILPFKIKRIFFSIGKKNYFRGDHAHKKCTQLLICLNGQIEIQTLNLKNKKKTFFLSKKKNNALLIPTYVWSKIYFKSKNSFLGVLCDYKYDNRNEYIDDYNIFKNLIKKNIDD